MWSYGDLRILCSMLIDNTNPQTRWSRLSWNGRICAHITFAHSMIMCIVTDRIQKPCFSIHVCLHGICEISYISIYAYCGYVHLEFHKHCLIHRQYKFRLCTKYLNELTYPNPSGLHRFHNPCHLLEIDIRNSSNPNINIISSCLS